MTSEEEEVAEVWNDHSKKVLFSEEHQLPADVVRRDGDVVT